jgi:hypothetical protein
MPTSDTLRRTTSSVCQARGYCGPFINAERYTATPGWDGIADCVTCHNTVEIERHRMLWERSLTVEAPPTR